MLAEGIFCLLFSGMMLLQDWDEFSRDVSQQSVLCPLYPQRQVTLLPVSQHLPASYTCGHGAILERGGGLQEGLSCFRLSLLILLGYTWPLEATSGDVCGKLSEILWVQAMPGVTPPSLRPACALSTVPALVSSV